MRKTMTIGLALASVLVAGSGAMAQSRAYGSDWMAAAPPPAAVRPPFNLVNPYDAYDATDSSVPFGGSRPWGTARGSASAPGYNPALDRAKGNLD